MDKIIPYVYILSYISPRIIKRKSIILPEYLIRTLKLLKAINRTNSKYVCTYFKNENLHVKEQLCAQLN